MIAGAATMIDGSSKRGAAGDVEGRDTGKAGIAAPTATAMFVCVTGPLLPGLAMRMEMFALIC